MQFLRFMSFAINSANDGHTLENQTRVYFFEKMIDPLPCRKGEGQFPYPSPNAKHECKVMRGHRHTLVECKTQTQEEQSSDPPTSKGKQEGGYVSHTFIGRDRSIRVVNYLHPISCSPMRALWGSIVMKGGKAGVLAQMVSSYGKQGEVE